MAQTPTARNSLRSSPPSLAVATPISVTKSSISLNASTGVATVTTKKPHGRNDNEWLVISGAIQNGSDFNSFNGSYKITRVNDFSFTYKPFGDTSVTPTATITMDGMTVTHFT